MSQAGIVDVEQNNPQIPTLFICDTGSAIPVANTLNVLGDGSTISTTGSGSTITISAGGTWNVISSSQALVRRESYICVAPGGALSLSLPVTSSVGDLIEVTLDGATSFTITQGAGQQIRMGSLSTTAGVGGSLTSTAQGDTVRMVCSVADLKWNVLSSMGNPTVV